MANLAPGCEGRMNCSKLHFSTKRYAKDAAKNARRNGLALSVYLCPKCGQWHLCTTRKSKAWQKAMRSA